MSEDFFGELGKSITRTTKKAVDRTGDFIEKTKISAQISGEQKEIGRLYQQIGEIVYRSIKAGEMSSTEEIDPFIHDIDAHSGQVDSYRRTLADVSDKKVCTACGALISLDAAFCPKCGAAVPVAPASDVTVEDENGEGQ